MSQGTAKYLPLFLAVLTLLNQTFYSSLSSFVRVVVWRGRGARRILERVQAECGWMRCAARGMSFLWSSVLKVPGGNTTVCTQKTQGCPAVHSQVG